MPINLSMAILSATEFALWVILGLIFWKKTLQKRFPAMRAYLLLRICSQPLLLLLLVGQARHWLDDYCYAIYFYTFWFVYIASACILFFVSYELFRNALSSFTGLLKLGSIAFRWAAVVSLIVSLSSTSYTKNSFLIIADISFGLMRSVSILELCLLAFLCVSLNALRISARSVPFGISLGFGVLATSDFGTSTISMRHSSLNEPMQYIAEILTIASLSIWLYYTMRPEETREPYVVPANTTLYRWNEIAAVLGHSQTKVAVQQPSTGFFLTDVERVVDKVMARNLANVNLEDEG